MTRPAHDRPSATAMNAQARLGRLATALIALVLMLSLAGYSAAWAKADFIADKTSAINPKTAISANDAETAGTTSGLGATSASGDLSAAGAAGMAKATVLVYLNGSDLESYAGEASADIAEMLDSGIGAGANVIIETIGTSDWQDFGIASDHTQRYRVNKGELQLVDDSLGQLASTDPDSLSDFISWGVANYPAERYILVMWDHGAGPVYGFGYDEFQDEEEALTLEEIQLALANNSNVHFDIIGMDCCIMSSLETCVVLKPFCDYAVLSEDFEPGVGWSYQGWMSLLEQNPDIDARQLGINIVNDMISAVQADEENGEATLALIEESAIDALFTAWVDFAYANEDALLADDLSQQIQWQGRPAAQSEQVRSPEAHERYDSPYGTGHGVEGAFGTNGYESAHGTHGFENAYGDWESLWQSWGDDASYVTMTDYFVTDIMEVASTIESTQASALKTATQNALAHYRATSGEEGMSGLGVTLPYGDADFYDELVEVFTACGIDASYIDWLEAFVNVQRTSEDDWSDYDSGDWGGYGYDDWGGYAYGYGNDGESWRYGRTARYH